MTIFYWPSSIDIQCEGQGQVYNGYKYRIHNRPVGQSMPNCKANNISNILCYTNFVIVSVKFVHSDMNIVGV